MIALAYSCRELLPIMDMVAFIGQSVGLSKDLTTKNVSIHEHYVGALCSCQRHYHLSTHLEVNIMLLRPFGFMK